MNDKVKILVDAYWNEGSITIHEFVGGCLDMLDPAHPELVLSGLDPSIYSDFIEYCTNMKEGLKAGRKITSFQIGGTPSPHNFTIEKMDTILNWIRASRFKGAK